ncbi:MAG: hypothetical protein AUK54_08745 [Helicobacteraceae bacterium CG2_30_36_10]|nr:MAG: hypothetical protein AUK54_08745 [Helicobacteraceae bacterium CG2_30_36_10]
MKLLLLLLITQSLFALVSIVPVEIGEDPGLHGKIGISLETKRGNTEKDNYKASLRATYDSNASYVTWAEFSGEYGESSSVEDTNKLYSHLRYIHKVTEEVVRVEAFAQLQTDKFKLLKERALGGAGTRFKIFEVFKDAKGYFGIGGLYEHISYIQDAYNNPNEDNIRFNNYLAYTIKFGEDSSFSYTFYYQPLYDNINDYVASHDVELKLHVYKELFLQLSVSYNLDSKPPIGVKREDFTQESTFVFNF